MIFWFVVMKMGVELLGLLFMGRIVFLFVMWMFMGIGGYRCRVFLMN